MELRQDFDEVCFPCFWGFGGAKEYFSCDGFFAFLLFDGDGDLVDFDGVDLLLSGEEAQAC